MGVSAMRLALEAPSASILGIETQGLLSRPRNSEPLIAMHRTFGLQSMPATVMPLLKARING
jgi:hypothetical protein